MPDQSVPQTLIRLPEVIGRTGLSRTSIWRRVRAGRFPAPVSIGAHSIAWHSAEVDAWIVSLARQDYGAGAQVA